MNKKNAVTYSLSVRSDRGEAVSVLTPVKAYGREVVPEGLYDELKSRFEDNESGEEGENEQFEDGTESSEEDPMLRFTKPIGVVPGAVFITPEGEVLNAQNVSSWKPEALTEPGQLVKRQEEKVKYNLPGQEDIDEDILEALENAEDAEGFEDDFVSELMQGEGDGEFTEVGGGYGLDDLEGDDDFAPPPKKTVQKGPVNGKDKMKYSADSDEYDEYDDDDASFEIPESKPRANKLVDDMFDAALDRFDEGKLFFLYP